MKGFDYGDDLDGSRCPTGSHIRRANPRGALEFGKNGAFATPGALVNRRRIIRRGLPYGKVEDPKSDNGNHGIIFMALNASIKRQFEFVQQHWMNYGNIFGLGTDKDPLIGDHDGKGKFLIQGDVAEPPGRSPHICQGLQRFVVTRGGDYFFLPSISGLKMLARGDVDAR